MAENDTWEQIGQLIDRLDNVIGALELPMPAPFHVEQVKGILPEISKELKAVVVAGSGDNPWRQPSTMTTKNTTDSNEQPGEALKPCWCRTSTTALSVQSHMAHGDFGCRERGRYVYCSNCWACGPAYNTDAEAIQGWNRSRASASASVAAVEGDAHRLTKLYGELAARCFIHAHVDGEAQYAVAMHDVDEAFKTAAASSSLPATCPTCGHDYIANSSEVYDCRARVFPDDPTPCCCDDDFHEFRHASAAAPAEPVQPEGEQERCAAPVVATGDDEGEANRLAFAVESAAVKAGIIKGDQPLTGPQLLMLCDDLATAALRTPEQK